MKQTRAVAAKAPSQNQPEEAEKVVVLLGKNTLLGSTIEILLAPKVNWKVVKMQTDFNPAMIRNIEKIAPNVVIVFQNDRAGGTSLLGQLLQECPGLKVITVSLESNFIQIYKNQKIWIKDAADLLSAVEI